MIFPFKCKECNYEIEVDAPIGTSPHVPQCNCGGEFQRVFVPLGTRFRCSGFYQTDKVLTDPPNPKDM